MIRLIQIAALAFGALVTASAANAVEKKSGSDFGYSAIENKNWAAAETQLRSELASEPNDAMRMVNLAFVLQQQGRSEEAADLYRRVLSLKSNPVVAVGPEDRVKGVRVKSIANKGIASIEQTGQ